MDIEKIHKYIDGDLKGADLTNFEQELKSDEALRTEVELQREMISHLAIAGDIEDAKSAIKNVHESYSQKSTPKKSNLRIWSAIAIAASFALFFIIRGVDATLSADELYATYYSPPPASFNTKGDTPGELLEKAEIAFNSKNYNEALDLFNEYSTNTAEYNGEVAFYKGLCHMSLGDYEDALNTFTELKSTAPLFAKDCDWYSALIYLKINNNQAAKTILGNFTEGAYGSKALEILKALDRIKKSPN